MAKKRSPSRTVHTDSRRLYRDLYRPKQGETGFQVVVEQSDLWITARGDTAPLSAEAAALLRQVRGMIESRIVLQPAFATSLAPLEVAPGAPEPVRAMAEAGRVCGVGPMAAVAGTVAEYVARGLAGRSRDVLVENGGDIFVISETERVVGLLADPAQQTGGSALGLRLGPGDTPTALCASSAVIGHSLSLGAGDLVVVRADSGALADAAATALCNMLREAKDLEAVVDQAQAWADPGLPLGGIRGVLAQCGEHLAVWGEMELAAL